MSVPSLFDGMAGVRGAVTADLHGRPLPGPTGAPEVPGHDARATAVAMSELMAAGIAAGLTRLDLVSIKGDRTATVTAVRPDAFLLVVLDPSSRTIGLEKALHGWTPAARSTSPDPAPADPRSAAVDPAPPTLEPRRETPPPVALRPTPAPQAAPARPAAGTPGGPARDDPWACLRWSLVRGQLTEAAARQRDLGGAEAAGRPGAEPLDPAERERAMQALLEGIGSVMAGDGIGGARSLRDLASPSQHNLSFRWLALHWTARAVLEAGGFAAARPHVKEALALAQQLDVEARAVSQWTAAEVLARGGDHDRALAWLGEARTRFTRLGDQWGLAQTWLAQSRMLSSMQLEQEAAEAARQAWAADPSGDEPPIFLARSALLRQDAAEAERILSSVATPAADRVRTLIEALRQGVVSQADASEFLREHAAPPTTASIRALERIAGTSPRFLQVREALAWMLLKVGRYAEASTIFRGLLEQPLTPGDRSSVMLGLGCIANAQQAGNAPGARLHAAVASGGPASPPQPAVAPPPLPRLSSSAVMARRPAEGAGALNAMFSGQLSIFALPDLLEFLRSARRTGLLVCSSGAGMGALRFSDGRITSAESPGTPGVGQLLLQARKVSSLALSAVAKEDLTDQPDHLVGELLVREGLVEAADVQAALERRIEMTIRELLAWKDGEFAFSRDGEREQRRATLSVEVDPQAVLLNVFKEQDERARASATPGARR